MDIEASSPHTPLTRSTLKTGAIWFLLVVFATAPLFPLSNFVGHPHWDHVRWIPFQDFFLSRNMLKDVIGNTVWFMVLGYLLHYQLNWDSRSRWTIATITVIAGGISISTELFQAFCHNRISSMTDVACNTLGAGLGGYTAEKLSAATSLQSWLARRLSQTSSQRFHRTPSVCGQDLPLQIKSPP